MRLGHVPALATHCLGAIVEGNERLPSIDDVSKNVADPLPTYVPHSAFGRTGSHTRKRQ